MLEKVLDLKNTFEGKFIAVFMSAVLVLTMSNFAAFAEGDGSGSSTDETAVEQPSGEAAEQPAANTQAAPAPAQSTATDEQAVQESVQHGTDAAASSGDPSTVNAPITATEVGEAVVTFEVENAYVSVKDQILYAKTLTTELHKELKFSASADTGFEVSEIKARTSANEDVPVVTQDGVSTIAADNVDSTLVVTVKTTAVEAEEPPAVETTPITGDSKVDSTEGVVEDAVQEPAEGEAADQETVEGDEPEAGEADEVVEVAADVSNPAFEGYAQAGNVLVKVTAAKGVLPEGTTVQATRVERQDVVDAVAQKVEDQGKALEDAVAIDVTLRDKDGKEVQPEGAVNVCFFDANVEGDEVSVFRVSDDASQVEAIGARQADAAVQSFDVDHFTIYVVSGTGGQEVVQKAGSFKTVNVGESIVLSSRDDDGKEYYATSDHAWSLQNGDGFVELIDANTNFLTVKGLSLGTATLKHTFSYQAEANAKQVSAVEYVQITVVESSVEVTIQLLNKANKVVSENASSIASGDLVANAPIQEGHVLLGAYVGDVKVSHAETRADGTYYAVEGDLSSGVGIKLGEKESIVLRYKELDNEVLVTSTVTGDDGVEGNVVSALPNTVKKGDSFSFRVDTARGYEVVVAAGDQVLDSKDGTYTVSDVTDNVIVAIQFKKIEKVTFDPGVFTDSGYKFLYTQNDDQLPTPRFDFADPKRDGAVQSASVGDEGADFTFAFNTRPKTTWQIDSFNVNGVYLNIPKRQAESSAVTTLYSDAAGACTATLSVTKITYSEGRPSYHYQLSISGAKENLRIDAANLNQVDRPEIIPFGTEGIVFQSALNKGNAGLNLPHEIDKKEAIAIWMEFRLKDGYKNLSAKTEFFNSDGQTIEALHDISLPTEVPGTSTIEYYNAAANGGRGQSYTVGTVTNKGEGTYRIDYKKGSELSGSGLMLQFLELTCEKELYGVRYEAEGGSSAITDERSYDVSDNATVVVTSAVPEAPANKFFVGWTIKEDASGKVYNAGDIVDLSDPAVRNLLEVDDDNDGTLVFEAKYADKLIDGQPVIVPIDVYLMKSDGKYYLDSNNSTNVKSVKGALAQCVNIPMFDAYTFQEEKSTTSVTADGNERIVLYYAPDVDELTYIANDGIGSMDAAEGRVGWSVAVAENGFTREGYTFDGWNTEADGSGTAYAAGDTYKLTLGADVLYAQWAKNVDVKVAKVWANPIEGVDNPDIELQLYKVGKDGKETPQGDAVTLKNGATEHVFAGLSTAGGVTYTVKETKVGGKEVKGNQVAANIEGVTGDVKYTVGSERNGSDITITNTRDTHILTVTNIVVDKTIDSEEGLAETFAFTVGKSTVKLGNDQSARFAISSATNVVEKVKGKTWIVRVDGEESPNNVDPKKVSGGVDTSINASVDGSSDSTITFENVRRIKDFAVAKQWFIPSDEKDTALPESLTFDLHRTTEKNVNNNNPGNDNKGPGPSESTAIASMKNQTMTGWALESEGYFVVKSGSNSYDNLSYGTHDGYEWFYGAIEHVEANWSEISNGFSGWVSGNTAQLGNYYNVTSLSGSKTWIDFDKTSHNNSEEVKLTLTRHTYSDSTKKEIVDLAKEGAVLVWSDDGSYVFMNLPKYKTGVESWIYEVTEEPVAGYVTFQDGNNFTNQKIRTISVIADSNTKSYDGTPLTDGGFKAVVGGKTYVSSDGSSVTLDNGDVLSVAVVGSALDVGDDGVNRVIDYSVKNASGEDVTTAYALSEEGKIDGKLTITKRDLSVYALDTRIYNGQEQTLTISADDNVEGLLEGEKLSLQGATITGKDVNIYAKVSEGYTWSVSKADGSPSTNNYNIEVTGQLVIEKDRPNAYGASVFIRNWTYDGAFDSAGTLSSSTLIQGHIEPVYSYYEADGKDWALLADQPVDAGDYKVVATWAATDNYPTLKAEWKFEIGKRAVAVVDTLLTTYNGTQQVLTIDAKKANEMVPGKDGGLVKGETLTLEGATISGKNAGTYTNVAEGYTWSVVKKDGSLSTGNYSIAVTGTLTIGRVALTLVSEGATKVYDGTPLTRPDVRVVTGAFVNDEASAYAVGSATNAGETSKNRIQIKGSSSYNPKNYAYTTSEGDLAVVPQSVNPEDAGDPDPGDLNKPIYAGIVIDSPKNVVYNGNEQKWPPTVSDKGGKLLAEGVDYTVSYSDDVTNVGTVTVTITGIGNYGGTVERVYNITPKPVTIKVNNGSKEFGTGDPGFTGNPVGLVKEGDLGTIVYSRTNADEAVDTYPGVLTATYTDNPNYTVHVENGDFTIVASNANTVKITTEAEGLTKTYDGQPVSITAEASVAGSTLLYSTDKADDKAWSKEKPSFTNAGTYTVYVKATHEGYEDTPAVSATIVINQKPVTITVNDDSKVYGTGDPSITGSVGELVKDDDLGEVKYVRTNASVEKVGVYPGVLTADYVENPNYKVEVVSGSFEITPQAISANDPDDVTYNGQEQKRPPVVTDPSGKVLVPGVDYDAVYSDDMTNAGTVTVTITGKGNYAGIIECTYQITRAKATVKVDDSSKVFGTGDPAFTGQVEGLFGDDSLGSITYTRANANEEVGRYEKVLTATIVKLNPNYTYTVVNGDFTIEPADSNMVSATGVTKTYDKEPVSIKATAVQPGSTLLYSRDDETWSEENPSFTDAGNYRVYVKATNPNFNETDEVSVNVVIGKAPLTITADDASKVYGADDPDFSHKVTGLFEGDVLGDVAYARANDAEDAGTYPGVLTAEVEVEDRNPNYTYTFIPGDFTITPAKGNVVSIDANGLTKTYDGQPASVTASAAKPGSTLLYSLDGTAWSKTNPTFVDADTYTVYVKATNPNFEDTAVEHADVVINKAPVTITVASDSKKFGASDPAFTGEVSGLVAEGDLGQVAYSRTNDDENVGVYPDVLTADYVENSNYEVTVANGSFAITPQNISANDPTEVTYNGQEQKWTPTVKGEDGSVLVPGVDYDVTYSDDMTNVGTVTVTITGKGNYAGTVDRSYEIAPKPATIRVNDSSKAYGESDPAFNGAYEGLVGTDSLGTVVFSRTNADEAVGTYEGVLTAAVEGLNPNYTYTVVPGDFAIEPAGGNLVRIDAEGLTKTYDGQPVSITAAADQPGSTLLYSLDGQTWSEENPSFTDADTNTVYVKATNPNFSETIPVSANVVINKAPVTITVADASKKFGADDPAFTGTVSGLVAEGDLGQINYVRAGGEENVGVYANALTALYAQNANYKVTVTNGSFTITPQAISSNDPVDVTYNGQEQKWAPTVTDENGNVLIEGVDYDVVYSDDATNAGTVTVTIKGKGNYAGTVDRTYEIAPAAVVIRVNDSSKAYGESDPAFTGAIEGVFGSDSLGTVSYSRTNAAEEAGTYEDVLTATVEGRNPNYTYTVESGSFTIAPADGNLVRVDAAGLTKTYDGQPVNVTAAADKPGSTVLYSLDGQTWSETNPSFTDAGTYTVRVKATNPNFAETSVVSANVVISRAPVTITVADASKMIGAADPVFTGTVEGLVVEGDLGTVAYSRTNVEEAAGVYANVLTATYTDNPNYAVTVVNGTFTIAAAPVTPDNPTPVTPATPTPTPTPTPLPTPGTPPPDNPLTPIVTPVVDALANAAQAVIGDNETPLAQGENRETQIADNGTPLAAGDHPSCWVHFYMILGIIVTAVYGACVALRRSLFSRKLKQYEDNLTGGGDPAPGTPVRDGSAAANVARGVPAGATMAAGLGE